MSESDKDILSQFANDFELLEALETGMVAADSLDQETLDRLVDSFGIDVVCDALEHVADFDIVVGSQRMSEYRLSRPSAETKSVASTKPARLDLWRTRSTQASWVRRYSPVFAMAAMLAVIAGVLFFRSGRDMEGDGSFLRGPGGAPDPSARYSISLNLDSDVEPVRRQAMSEGTIVLAPELPDFEFSAGTLGATDESASSARMATVIVQSPQGHGSGVFVSPDGWVLTSYQVVENAVQSATLEAKQGSVDIIAPTETNGRIVPDAPIPAMVYKVDPELNVALLKLDRLPQGRTEVPFLQPAEEMGIGASYSYLGSQQDGIPWWTRAVNILGFTRLSVPVRSAIRGWSLPDDDISDDGTIFLIAESLTPDAGDFGGPLVDAEGRLAGLTLGPLSMENLPERISSLAVPPNLTEPGTAVVLDRSATGSINIPIFELTEFLDDKPNAPETPPFDIWAAGKPSATIHEPEIVDLDGDGQVDAVNYQYTVTEGDSDPDLYAAALYANLSHSFDIPPESEVNILPNGLWGFEFDGGFDFDLCILVRADGVVAVGYVGASGAVEEIRIGQSGDSEAELIWRQSSDGRWTADSEFTGEDLIDVSRYDDANRSKLDTILRHLSDTGVWKLEE